MEMKGGGNKSGKPRPTSRTSETILGGGSLGGSKGTKCERGAMPIQPPCASLHRVLGASEI